MERSSCRGATAVPRVCQQGHRCTARSVPRDHGIGDRHSSPAGGPEARYAGMPAWLSASFVGSRLALTSLDEFRCPHIPRVATSQPGSAWTR